ncbi:hypothetical protein BDR05DRAFT_945139 [Suillus weaverae]|nr:hypothetical protein BDR05DRAFT_945139 [Suillus weaverae]
MNVDHEHSPLRNTQTLTLSCVTARWWNFVDTPQGSAFLASISHLTFLTNTSGETTTHHATGIIQGLFPDYTLLLWIASTPWASLFLLPPIDVQFTGTRTGMDLQTELLTLSASLLRAHRDYFPRIIKPFTEIGPGEECTRSGDVHFKVTRSRVHFWNIRRRPGRAGYVTYTADERHYEVDAFPRLLRLYPDPSSVSMFGIFHPIQTPESVTHTNLQSLCMAGDVSDRNSGLFKVITLPNLHVIEARHIGPWPHEEFKAFLKRSKCPLERLIFRKAVFLTDRQRLIVEGEE